MERIAVIGCAGSGKTTLARDLGARLGIDVVHLDRLHYGPDWNTPPPAEWEAVQRRLVREERWIADGTYASTMPIRLAAADTVVFLDLPTHVCLWSIARRRLRFRGRSRPDLGVYDRISRQFLRFVWSFRRTRRPQVLALIEQHARPDATIIRLRRRRDAQALSRVFVLVDPHHAPRMPVAATSVAQLGGEGGWANA